MNNDGLPSRSDAPDLPLFRAFPRLAAHVPAVGFGSWPTPVQPLRAFAARHGLHALFIKRDDSSRAVMGGNKVRGLEFLLAEARCRGARTILTMGAAGSHHVAVTACLARELDMGTTALLVPQAPADYVEYNVRACLVAGAKLVPTRYAAVPARFAYQWLHLLRHDGRAPFVIPPGGTTALACLGHVNAALELRAQVDGGLLPCPDFLFVPLGSLGTAAGLLVGLRLARLPARLVGVVAYHPWFCTAGRVAALARRVGRLLRRLDPSIPVAPFARGDLDVITTAWGGGYARRTPEGTAAAADLLACEGLVADGTYTSKALAGMLDFARNRGLRGRTLLFWHTYCAAPRPGAAGPAMGGTTSPVRTDSVEIPPALRAYFTDSGPR